MFEVRGGESLRRVSRELRAVGAGKEIKKQLSKEIRAAARPLVPLVRASISSIPSGHDGTLRKAMAKATRLDIKTVGKNAQVAVRVDGRKMPPHQGSLPAYMEGTKPRWRHPLYGNRKKWFGQPPHPYFYRVVKPAGIRARVGVYRALDNVSKQIR
jgi:hypothetical protein